jgi:aminopeptidase N
MNFKSIIFLLVILLAYINCNAGGYRHKMHKSAARTTLADPAEENYDMKHLKFNLHVSDTSVYLWGDVSTTAQVVAVSMPAYVFELDTLMVIDSAQINGVTLPVTNVGFVRTISLPTALSSGAMFTAQIFYHGVPPPGGGFFNGLTQSVSAEGTPMLYTVSDPWVALDWWPAKQSATDKIDSVDMFVTVPTGQVDGSNGVLVNVDTTTTPGFRTYHWQTHYAIDYYLISIAVSQYAEYKSYLHFTGSADSMLIQNFFIDTATFNSLYKANFDSLSQIIDYYSSLFGRYPFWQEKYGVCYTSLPGGMEHQTMTTIGVPNTYIIAHELMHQWFGDHVTYATWGEMWLSEGFACWAEQLFLNHFWGAAAATTHRQTYLNIALSDLCGEVYVTDTTSSNTLFYQPTVYYKGQGIVTMLRDLAPTDSQFFLVLQTYQYKFGSGNAGIANMNAIVDSIYGFSLDSFFHQWIYGQGYPEYTITWDQAGSNVIVKLVQSPSCPTGTKLFYTPVELELKATAADTIVMPYNTLDTQVFVFNWADTMTSLLLNPDALTVCARKTIIKQDTTLRNLLGTGTIQRHNYQLYPNPTKNFWQISNLPEDTGLTLTDINGKVLWRGRGEKGVTIIPGTGLAAGNYMLKLSGSDSEESIKLVHW